PRTCPSLSQQNQDLGLQLGTLSHSEAELLESNQRLRDTLERAREDLRSTCSQAERTQHEAKRLVEERCVEGLEVKGKLQERDAELQEKYGLAKEKLQRAALAQKKRENMTKKRYQDTIQRLAKMAELELQTSSAKKRSSVGGWRSWPVLSSSRWRNWGLPWTAGALACTTLFLNSDLSTLTPPESERDLHCRIYYSLKVMFW
uniref:Uncharacterized protein n=1 Tax=Hucho hucho TaxID=62062 RepID=A0A4W5RZL8_9TELE